MSGKRKPREGNQYSQEMADILERWSPLTSTAPSLGETSSQELTLHRDASLQDREVESTDSEELGEHDSSSSSPQEMHVLGSPGSKVDSFYHRSVRMFPSEVLSDGTVLIPAQVVPRRSQMDYRSTLTFVFASLLIFLAMGVGSAILLALAVPLMFLSIIYPSFMTSMVWGTQFNVYVICDAEYGQRARSIVADELRWYIKENPLYSPVASGRQAALERKLAKRLRDELGDKVSGVEVKFRASDYTHHEKRSGELPILHKSTSAGMLHHALRRDATMRAKGEENSNIIPRGGRISLEGSVVSSASASVSPIQRRLRGITRSGAPENVKSLAQSLSSLLSVEGELSPSAKSRLGSVVHEFLDVMDDLDTLKSSAFEATEEERSKVQQCFAILEAPVKSLEEEYLSQRRGALESRSMYLAEKYGSGDVSSTAITSEDSDSDEEITDENIVVVEGALDASDEED